MITDVEYRALKRAVLLRETRTVEFEGRKVLFLEKIAPAFQKWSDVCRPLSGSSSRVRSALSNLVCIQAKVFE